MVTSQHGDTTAVRRCLTVLSRLFSANPLFTIETMGLALALRLHKWKNDAADSAVCISKLMVAIANLAS
jgi:hypothetical protein